MLRGCYWSGGGARFGTGFAEVGRVPVLGGCVYCNTLGDGVAVACKRGMTYC